ncbi:MAG: EamA family transporter [Bacteroidales bacterium]
MTIEKNQLKGFIYGIISSATFGLIPLFALPALKAGIGLESVMLYRFGISTLAIGAYLILRGESLKVSLKEFITLFFLGTFYASTALFLTASYLYIPSGIATTIHFLYPVVVSAIMIILFRERVSKTVMGASLMALAGVWLISSSESGGTFNLKGMIFVLSTVVTYALYIVGVNKSIVAKMDGLKMTFFVLLSSTIVFIINLLISGEPLASIPDMQTGINLFLLAIIPTLVSDFTLILAIQHIGSTKTAVLGCMEPVTAVITGILIFHEKMELSQFLGIGIILLAVTFVILGGNRKPAQENVQLKDK